MDLRGLAFFYLQNVLRISDPSLMRIVLQYPNLLYLQPTTNLAPTVAVLRSFGFLDRDVRHMVEMVTSVLSINHEWTLPEKLLSLQQCFHLSKRQLVRLCVRQPFVLTCSIARNMAVLAFFEDTCLLSARQVGRLLGSHPALLTTSLGALEAGWALLLDVYGFTEGEAAALVLKDSRVLCGRATSSSPAARVDFFGQTLCLPPPFSDLHALLATCPRLLYIDVDYFLRPNAALLQA